MAMNAVIALPEVVVQACRVEKWYVSAGQSAPVVIYQTECRFAARYGIVRLMPEGYGYMADGEMRRMSQASSTGSG